MNRVFRGITAGVILLTAAFCVVGVKRCTSYIFSIEGYACKFDGLVSQSHKNKIFDFINVHNNFKYCSLGVISKKIKEQFKCVKSIEAFQLANGVLNLNFTVYVPKFVINKNYVMTENKSLFKKNIFEQEALLECMGLKITNFDFESGISDACMQMIFGLPKVCFEKYNITRESETRSYMRNMQQSNFIILFSDELFPDENILIGCDELKKRLGEQGAFDAKPSLRQGFGGRHAWTPCKAGRKAKARWVADVRFKDQIVLCKEVRGR